jgi:general secretion pathway protein G
LNLLYYKIQEIIKMYRLKKEEGVSLLELLTVVAIIAVIVIILIPVLLDAHQSARQKETMADMRAIAVALGSYMVVNDHYPTNLAVLTPQDIRLLPQVDSWGNPWVYNVFGSYSNYSLSSGGRDGGGHAVTPGPITDFDDSITMVNGVFAAYPEGTQTD